MNKGKLFVISGPSGSGKSTVIGRLLKELDKAYFSISATTREPRKGEQDGVDYHFMKKEEFEKLIAADQLLEYAQFVGNYYGTPAAPVDEKLNAGYDVILDIETQGAEQILSKRPDAVSIFVFPPSFEILEQRLRSRGTDSEEKILGRLAQARVECKKAKMYNYLIINDKIETACDEMMAIITAEKCRTAERLYHLDVD